MLHEDVDGKNKNPYSRYTRHTRTRNALSPSVRNEVKITASLQMWCSCLRWHIHSLYVQRSICLRYLKFRGSFVRDMVVDQVDRALVASINQIGHVMKLKTIAEFAENEGVLIALERVGVLCTEYGNRGTTSAP